MNTPKSTRDGTQLRLDRVQNTAHSQSVTGWLLGYGDLTVYAACSGDPGLTFEHLPRPQRPSAELSERFEDGPVVPP